MSKIKVLFGALTDSICPKTVRLGICPCTLSICSYNNWLKKRAHTGCTPPKIVHPSVKMCAPGAGCTLNFGHCISAYTNVIMILFLLSSDRKGVPEQRVTDFTQRARGEMRRQEITSYFPPCHLLKVGSRPFITQSTSYSKQDICTDFYRDVQLLLEFLSQGE